jgi:putative ABC transport system permease protein
VRLLDRHRLALGALLRSPWRTAMMLLATTIGVTAVLVLTALGDGARVFVTAEFRAIGNHLLVVLPGRTETTGAGPALMAGATPRDITLGDARALLRGSAILRVAPVVIGEVPVSVGPLERDSPVMGTTTEFFAIRGWRVAAGEVLPQAEMERAAPVCVLGHVVARELFRGRQAVGEWIRLRDRRCRVIGVLESQGMSVMVDADQLVLMPVAMAQSLFNTSGLFRIMVQAKDRDSVPAARRFVQDTIRARHYGDDDVTIITQDAVLSTFDGIFAALTAALAGIAAVSLVVAGVLIMNVMLVAVAQRTQEVGLLKALGARRRQIIGIFLTEAIYLAGCGALVGVSAGYAICLVLGELFPTFPFSPPLWAVVGSTVMAVACGALFGILPARQAAALDPVAALSRR